MGLLDQRLGYEEPTKPKKNVKIPSFGIAGEFNQAEEDININQNIEQNIDTKIESKEEQTNDNDILGKIKPANNIPQKRGIIQEQNISPKSDNMFERSLGLDSEEELVLSSLDEARKEEQSIRKHKKRTKIISIAMVTLCVYVIYLIYGVFCTTYQYDENGKIIPVTLTVKEIDAVKDYNEILVQYEDCRVLYEKVLQLDYRLGQGVEDPLTLAPEYEELLDEVNTLTVKTEALEVDMRYATIKSMLVTWVKTDTAVYLQKISSGISKNNSDDAATAVEYKNIMYNDFSVITQNMITIGKGIKGANINGLKKWSPEGYIDEFINGEKDD